MAEQQNRLCGVDEAGRGPLAGAVFAAAVILDPTRPISGPADSKNSPSQARCAGTGNPRKALAWAIASASVEEIDQINILHASMLAMARAVDALAVTPSEVQVDGKPHARCSNRCRSAPSSKGDAKVAEISASILAKTARDAELVALDAQYPVYGFARHKGLPTAEHLAAIAEHGVLSIHRKTFGPVKAWLATHQGELF